jgi:hypothetical protein
MHGAVGDQPGEGGGIALVGLASPAQCLGGEGQGLGTRLPELPLETPAEAARLHPNHAAPAACLERREQAQDGLASQRAQAHRLGEPALHGDARVRLFEIRPEAEHARRARRGRRGRGSFRALQALAERRKAFQDVFGLGVELVFFHTEFTLRQGHPLFVALPQMTPSPSFIPLTAPGVTAYAPATSLRSPPAAFPQPARRPPQSLSLGSLGVATRIAITRHNQKS